MQGLLERIDDQPYDVLVARAHQLGLATLILSTVSETAVTSPPPETLGGALAAGLLIENEAL